MTMGSAPAVTLRLDEPHPRVIAETQGERIGELDYEDDRDGTAFVASVHVQSGWRRRGVATAMCSYVRDVVGLVPTHAAPGCGNTAAGDAWVAALEGGRDEPLSPIA